MKKFFAIVIGLLIVVPILVVAQDSSGMTYEEQTAAALACVKDQFPSSTYATNDYLPTQADLENISPLNSPVTLRVGLGWIQNDEFALVYNADANGYFAAEGITVEIIPGGPGVDHVAGLAAGAVDIAISASGVAVPKANAAGMGISETIVGAMYKNSQYELITTDVDLLDREITPQDLVGRHVTVQPDGRQFIELLLQRNGIPVDSVTIDETAGFGPESIMQLRDGNSDLPNFYSGWATNQPWAIEHAVVETGGMRFTGIAWNSLVYKNWAINEYSDVFAVNNSMLESQEGQNIVRHFMRAIYRGAKFLVDNPEESAPIAAQYGADAGVTVERALWRFAAQDNRHLIQGDDDLPLLAMDLDRWNEVFAAYTQFGQTALECK